MLNRDEEGVAFQAEGHDKRIGETEGPVFQVLHDIEGIHDGGDELWGGNDSVDVVESIRVGVIRLLLLKSHLDYI